MDASEQQAVMTIALLAAFADGRNEERERDEVRRVAQSLDAKLSVPALVQEVLLGRVSVQKAAAAIRSPEVRRLAFELAVGVCDADGLRNGSETRFLAELGHHLGLDTPAIAETAADADELATMPLPAAAPSAAAEGGGDVVAATATVPPAELDRMILNAAIVNGALELLPQSLASMAIIPLQMKLVYRIGRAYGVDTDAAQVRELVAALGVGMSGQYLEQIGRRLLGGAFGAVAGGLAGALARGAAGAAMSFATTYAIGEVARRYYAGGRRMSADLLKQAFAELLAQGKSLQAQYVPQIEQQARSLDPSRILQLVRSS
jgi:uncharacterized protein (DUF697 family)/tellurite resistance protein